MKKYILSIILCISVFSVQAQKETNLMSGVDKKAMKHWVDSVFDSMSRDERIGQLFMPIVEPGATQAEKELLRKYITEYKIGGILFSKVSVNGRLVNGEPVKQAEMTNFAQSMAKVPLMISLDGEWGLAMRLDKTTRFPRNIGLGAIENDSLLYEYGREVGRQCREMGIHVNFSPSIDINTNPDNPVIGTRSFGETPALVSAKANAYSRGLESMGVIAVAKHFPGHGDTSTDSHHTLPVINHSRERMKSFELFPFQKFIDEGYSGVMSAHLSVPSLDKVSGNPASLSKPLLTDLLKKEMGFTGLVFTDALAMKGVANVKNHCVKALLAGNDVLLGPTRIASQIDSVKIAVENGTLPMSVVEEKCLKILRYKYITGLNSAKSVKTQGLNGRLNTAKADIVNRNLHANLITILKDSTFMLPFQRLEKKSFTAVAVGNTDDVFTRTLSKYVSMRVVNADLNANNETKNKLFAGIKNSDILIVGVYSNRSNAVAYVNQLVKGRDYVLVFFQSPYNMKSFRNAIVNAKSVVMAYENSPLASDYAAQAIFGGIDVSGKMSVTVPGLFASGTGERRSKTRLGYTLAESVGMSTNGLSEIDKIVNEGISRKAFPGAQVLVARKGQVIYQKSFGYFDNAKTKAVTDDDLYDLASVTKAAATVPAVMKAKDDFGFMPQYKLSKYIPSLVGTDKEGLTIRDALFHETGIQSFFPFYRMAIDIDALNGASLIKGRRDENYRLQLDKSSYAHKDFKYKQDLVSNKKSDVFCLQIAEGMYLNKCFSDSVLNKITSLPLKSKGTYRYSCLNFALLRMAVENVSGRSIDEYVRNEIYLPLGASSLQYNPLQRVAKTRIAPTENDYFLRKQVLIGYTHDEMAAFQGGVEGNAGLFGNAGDMAKLLQMLLNEGEYGGDMFYTKETARMFTRTKSANSRRGLGFDKPEKREGRTSPCAPEAPASVYGHTGFTGTCFWVDPDNELIYVFLTNRVYPHRWGNTEWAKGDFRTRVQSAIYKALDLVDSVTEPVNGIRMQNANTEEEYDVTEQGLVFEK